MSECIFCKIAQGKLPCDKVYEDEHIIAFKDLYPKAPVHVLVIPKTHVVNFLDLNESHQALMGHLTCKLPEIAGSLGLDEGFKTQINTGKKGGQEVFHLHYHILGEG